MVCESRATSDQSADSPKIARARSQARWSMVELFNIQVTASPPFVEVSPSGLSHLKFCQRYRSRPDQSFLNCYKTKLQLCQFLQAGAAHRQIVSEPSGPSLRASNFTHMNSYWRWPLHRGLCYGCASSHSPIPSSTAIPCLTVRRLHPLVTGNSHATCVVGFYSVRAEPSATAASKVYDLFRAAAQFRVRPLSVDVRNRA